MTKKLARSSRSQKRVQASKAASTPSIRLGDLAIDVSNILLSDDSSNKMMLNDQSTLSLLDSTMDQTHSGINNSICHLDDTLHHSMGGEANQKNV
jgi:hypothetical protein